MSIFVILGTPGAFDFEAFGESTRKTLALLAALAELEHSEGRINNEILDQVNEFARATRLGVEAAQCGFTATTDILTLTQLMDSTTLDDRTEYLQGTVELADQAYSKAQEAFQVFRDIRTKFFSMTETYNALATNMASPSRVRPDDAARRSIAELQKGIHILEEFGNKISALAQWWDWIKIETRVNPRSRTPTISFDDSSLRQKIVVERWALLRNQFADYTNMIEQLEDSYPELLLSSPDPVRQPPLRLRRRDNHRKDLLRTVRFIATGRTHSAHHSDNLIHRICSSCGCIVV